MAHENESVVYPPLVLLVGSGGICFYRLLGFTCVSQVVLVLLTTFWCLSPFAGSVCICYTKHTNPSFVVLFLMCRYERSYPRELQWTWRTQKEAHDQTFQDTTQTA